MKVVRAATWSQVLQSFRKLAWSGLSKPSTVGEMRQCAGVQNAPGACSTHSAVRLGGS